MLTGARCSDAAVKEAVALSGSISSALYALRRMKVEYRDWARLQARAEGRALAEDHTRAHTTFAWWGGGCGGVQGWIGLLRLAQFSPVDLRY